MNMKVIYGFLVVAMVFMKDNSAYAESPIYYVNPDGGKSFHCVRECKTIRSKYHAGMIEITEDQLVEEPYMQLEQCNICFKNKVERIPNAATKFYYHSVYDTGELNTQYTEGSYYSGISITPGIYTASSDYQCAGTITILNQEMQQLAAHKLTGECSVTFYLGDGMSVVIPENCILQKVAYNPGFQKAFQRTTIRYGRYLTMLEIPGAKYCVESIAGEAGYYILSTIQSEIGNEPVTVVEILPGETVELNLQGAYDVFVEFVNCIVWPSEQGEG